MLTILLCFTLFMPALAAAQVQVAVDGHRVLFPDEKPYIDDQTDRTMVPVRFVAEKLGASVQWIAKSNQVKLTYKDRVFLLTIGRNHAQLNGKDVALDAPAVIKNRRTMVPLRFISEGFAAQVQWVAERQLVVITTSGHSQTVAPAYRRGTWIWETKLIETDPDQLLDFARDNGLTAIYLQIDRDVKPKAYQNFIRRANERHLEVEALGGRPRWAYAQNREQIKEFIEWVQTYNASVKPEERFDRLHFDIEPYLLEEWHTKRNLILENWLDTLRFIEKETREVGLKISLDVPFWVHAIKVPGSDYSFSAWLLEMFDSLVIMDYRNFAIGSNGIVANANTILREASILKKQAVVAVETARTPENDKTSFYSLSAEAMEKELRIAREQLSRFSSFAGFAIHDYKSWILLKEKR